MTKVLITIIVQECNIEEVSDEEDPPSKSLKDKKSNGPDAGKASLVFKITSSVPYKTVLKGMFSCYCSYLFTCSCNYFMYMF